MYSIADYFSILTKNDKVNNRRENIFSQQQQKGLEKLDDYVIFDKLLAQNLTITKHNAKKSSEKIMPTLIKQQLEEYKTLLDQEMMTVLSTYTSELVESGLIVIFLCSQILCFIYI